MADCTTMEMVESALNVYKRTAKRFGLDYDGFHLVKNYNQYELANGGERICAEACAL